MPIFAFPWAFLGLFAAGGLAAVYLLRNRSRRWTVSSLMLWTFPTRPKHGGRMIQRIQIPLLFFLELLAILLIVLAAAGPRIRTRAARQMVVVLDDSFSMLANGGRSPRDQAEAELLDILQRDDYVVHLFKAGSDVEILGKGIRSREHLKTLLKQWPCLSPAGQLEKAVTLANEMCPGGRILVLTDHAPDAPPTGGRIEWHGFGLPSRNFAIVNAVRTAHDNAQRVLLEIANFSPADAGSIDAQTTLTIRAKNMKPRTHQIALSPGRVKQIVFDLPSGAPAITAMLTDDALLLDNQAVLLPEASRRVRVKTQIADSTLQSQVLRALEATGLTDRLESVAGVSPARGEGILPSKRPDTRGRDTRDTIELQNRFAHAAPDLLITDRPVTASTNGRTWTLQLLASKNAKSLLGPFIVDRANPLTEGLSLEGVVWAADSDRKFTGRPILLAGNTTLLADAEHASGAHDIRMQFTPKLSTLQNTPNWPVLFCNLLRWRGDVMPGLAQPNLRLGWQAEISLPTEMDSVNVTAPDGEEYTIPTLHRGVAVPARRIGVYRVQAGSNTYLFACNPISPGESDLTKASPGVWGAWDEIQTFQREYVSVAYAPILLALAVLVLHMALLARSGGRSGI
jgi:hypothetical protein